MKKFNFISSRALILLTILSFFSVGIICGEKAASPGTNRDRARYFYRKGDIAEANGKADEAYDYFKKAYEIDTTFSPAAFKYGSMRMMIAHDTLGTLEHNLASLRLMRKLIDEYPADYQSGMLYAQFASILDTFPESIRVMEILEKYHPKESVLQIYKANAYGEMGMADSAINAIRKYERLEGMSFESSLRKLRYHLLDNDTVGAIAEVDQLIATNPGDANYITYKAKVFELLNMPDSAFTYLNKAMEMAPDNGLTKTELAAYYAQRGDSATYDRLIGEALLSDNLDLTTKTQILAEYLQRMVDDKADLARSDQIMTKLTDQYPHEPEVLFISAKYAAAKRDFTEALRLIDYAIKLDGQNPEYISPKMMYLFYSDKPGEAMQVYEEARSEGKPLDDISTRIYLSSAQELKRNDIAIATLDSLIKTLAPDLSVADTVIDLSKLRNNSLYELYLISQHFQSAGDIYFNMDNLPETFRCYEDALAIFPDNDLALNNYAYFLIEKGGYLPGTPQFEKAKEMSRKTVENLESGGVPSTYLDTYAWILFKEKNYEEAEKYQRLAVEAAGPDADDVDLFSHFGDILFMNGKTDEAIPQWEKALKIEPDNQLLKKKVTHKTYFEK